MASSNFPEQGMQRWILTCFLIIFVGANIYMLRTSDSLLILFLYVDDLLITGSPASIIVVVKDIMHDRLFMMDMVPLHYFLGIKISQDSSSINLYHTNYVRDLLVIFHMNDYKLVSTHLISRVHLEDGGDTPLVDSTLYQQLMGSLLYLTHTHMDLSYIIGQVSRYMHGPHELHWKNSNYILIYFQGTIGLGSIMQ
jgi:hypothetical protein